MKIIPLTRGLFALVDDPDFEIVSRFKWHAKSDKKTFYAARSVRRPDGTRFTQRMHNLIMNTPSGFEVHHSNGFGLDNRHENLKVVSQAEHKRLAPKQANCSTGFRGVDFHNGRYRALIRHLGRRFHIGYFETADAAAKARDAKARALGWAEAGMNFPTNI